MNSARRASQVTFGKFRGQGVRRRLGPVLSVALLIGVGIATLLELAGRSTPVGVSQPLSRSVDPPAATATNSQPPPQQPEQSQSQEPAPALIGTLQRRNIPADAELHVIGVYEGAPAPDADTSPWWSHCHGEYADHVKCHAKFAGSHDTGFVDIDLTVTQNPIILALMSYEPVHWRLHASPGVRIAHVIVSGYYSQSVTGITEGVPIETYTNMESSCEQCWQGPGAAFYAHDMDGNRYGQAARRLWDITGKRATTFQGRYRGARFAISDMTPHLNYED